MCNDNSRKDSIEAAAISQAHIMLLASLTIARQRQICVASIMGPCKNYLNMALSERQNMYAAEPYSQAIQGNASPGEDYLDCMAELGGFVPLVLCQQLVQD